MKRAVRDKASGGPSSTWGNVRGGQKEQGKKAKGEEAANETPEARPEKKGRRPSTFSVGEGGEGDADEEETGQQGREIRL